MSYALFYKSVNGDRVYDDTSFEHWLKKFFTSGVFLNDLYVTSNNDMTVNVGTGYVNADGKVKVFEAETTLQIETAGATYPRIDSIVLERNDAERDILLKVIKGGYSSEPVAHVPVRQDGIYQLVIAQILVDAGAVKVTQANITDTRAYTDLCGIVAGAVDQVDFGQLQAQYDAAFKEWFEQLEDYISEDTELMLMSDVANLKTQVGAMEQAFRDGCDKLVADVTAKGVVPESNSPDDIIAAYNEAFNSSSGGGNLKFIGGTAFWMNYAGFNCDNLDTTYLKKQTSSEHATFVVQKDFEGIVELQITQYNTTTTPSVYCKVDGTTLLSVRCSNVSKLYRANKKATFTAGQVIEFTKGSGANCAATATMFVLE